MSNEGNQQPLDSLELVSSHAEKQLDLQWAQWDQVDGKLRLLLGFIGAVFVAVLAFASNDDESSSAAKALLISAVVLLLASGSIATLAWLPRKFDRPPEPTTLREHYLAAAQDETRLAVLDTMLEAYSENQRRINEKLAGFRYAALALGMAITLIAIAAIIEIGR